MKKQLKRISRLAQRKQRVAKKEKTIDLMVDESYSLEKRPSLQSTLETLRSKKQDIDQRMRHLQNRLRHAETIDLSKINEYVDLNKQQRKIRIMEAELMYIRNII